MCASGHEAQQMLFIKQGKLEWLGEQLFFLALHCSFLFMFLSSEIIC